ncbi:hypothetical protein C8R43DRAFT_1178230, partial [Mycena crocata]
LPGASVSNPISTLHGPEPPRPTQTIPQQTVYHTLQAEIRSMMGGVQTLEQLDDLRQRLGQIGDRLRDPPTISRKGRPLTKRLTGATEGRSQGGGGTASNVPRRQNCCSRCHQPGHNRSSCPMEM